MRRWPTTTSGLAVPPTELGFGVVEFRRGLTTNHHQYWNRRVYDREVHTSLFRNLVSHVFTLDREEHDNLHGAYSPPKMPKLDSIINLLDGYVDLHGHLDVVREKKTNEVYQVGAASWEAIRGGIRP